MAIYIDATDQPNHDHSPEPAPDGWTPFDLGDALLAYWDAEDLASLTLSGASVTAWADRKNGHTPTQSAPGSKPIYAPIGFNGRPGIVFDGVDDYLQMLGTIPFPQGTVPCEIWTLADFTAGNPVTSSIIGWGDGVAANANRAIRRLGTGFSNALFGNGVSNSVITNISVIIDGKHMLRARFEPTKGMLFVDDGLPTATTATLNSAPANNFFIGLSNIGNNNYLRGTASAMLITSLLSATQAAELNGYLKSR